MFVLTKHSAGAGFSVKEGPFDVIPETYATRYLDVTSSGGEYRVWFCGNRTIAGKRVKMECNENEKYPCRSKWGYSFCDGISKDLRNQTLLAAKKIGLEFGAADVLYYKGKWYFLELNSAPSIDHRIVREFYQSALAILIAKKFPESVVVPVVKIEPAAEKKSSPKKTWFKVCQSKFQTWYQQPTKRFRQIHQLSNPWILQTFQFLPCQWPWEREKI